MKLLLKTLGMAVCALASLAPAQTFHDIYYFNRYPDGGNPWATPILDTAGNLYGTTYGGGNLDQGHCDFNGCGVIYKVDANGQETPLYAFNGKPDGQFPVAGVVTDAAGDFYGTTAYGGVNGYGTVFKVNAAGVETILRSFTGGADGGVPNGGLVIDKQGNLYGTTFSGGSAALGTVFKVTSSGEFSTIYTFPDLAHGGHPNAALTLASGDLYGTTQYGGAANRGTVFSLELASGTETILYSFSGMPDGAYPQAQLVFHGGELYGTTTEGGLSNNGTIFRLTTAGAETILHNFGNSPDGSYPTAGVVLDKAGNLYGTTFHGGNGFPGSGVAYKVDTAGNETILYTFSGGFDGQSPASGLILNPAGTTVYGAVENSGLDCCGAVYSVTLP
jgi:uncharacterized repeat protein (TIGR03803 family)